MGSSQASLSVGMGQGSPGISTSSRIAAGRGHTGEQWVSSVGILSTRLCRAARGIPAPTWPPQGSQLPLCPCQSWRSATLSHRQAPPGLPRKLPSTPYPWIPGRLVYNFSPRKNVLSSRKDLSPVLGLKVPLRPQSWWAAGV